MTPKELAIIAAKALDEKKGKEISAIEITDRADGRRSPRLGGPIGIRGSAAVFAGADRRVRRSGDQGLSRRT